ICGSVLRNAQGCVNSPQKWMAPERRTTRRTSDKTSMGGPNGGGKVRTFSERRLQRQPPSVSAKHWRARVIARGQARGAKGHLRGGPTISLEEEYQLPGSVKDMLAAANAAVPKVGVEEAAALVGRDNVLVVDVRDLPELQGTGKIRGAVHVSRGML